MLQCPHCKYKATRLRALKAHLHKNIGDMLQCPHCEYETTHLSAFIFTVRTLQHVYARTSVIRTSDTAAHLCKNIGNMLQCPQCEYETTHLSALKAHLCKTLVTCCSVRTVNMKQLL